jgi:quinoprotein glucose dehydrogenase
MSGLSSVARWYEMAALAWYVYSAEDDESVSIPLDADDPGPTRYTNAGFQKLYDHEQLPASKPPWGSLTAIDLNRGEIAWRRPLGDYAAVLESGRSGLGAENYGGPVVSAGGLLFLAATPDAKLRAFDKATGEILWEAALPADGFATPAVYEADGRQFVVVAAGGGKLGRPSGSHYVAFALPQDGR